MLYYLLTFVLGIVLDFTNNKTTNSLKRVYILWLFIFLCFGYMTGSDWRNYELVFNNPDSLKYDIGFYYTFYFLKYFIGDFFIVLGLLKCLYLGTLIKLMKTITDYWLSAIAILMPISLNFMLIDNPLRFMVALTFINVAITYLLKGKYIVAILCSVISVFFHITSIFVVLLLPLVRIDLFSRVKSIWLLIAFLIIAFVFSDIGPISSVFEIVYNKLSLLNVKDFSSYTVENNDVFFTVGSLLNFFLFCVVLLCKKKVIASTENGRVLFSIAIASFYVSRILLLLPTGFRLGIPLGYFVAVYYSTIIHKVNNIKLIVCLYFALLLTKNVWKGYVYIPYSNSIPYIITEHLPYSERSQYNHTYYYKRFGKYWE